MCPRTHHPCLSLLFLLQLFHLITAVKHTPPYTPTDVILVNCGSSSSSNSPDGRHWDADVNTRFLASNSDSVSTATKQIPSIPREVPYSTARFSNSTFTYIFPLSPGPKFVRLHFNPSVYNSNLNTSQSFFSVTANNYTLLHNFSAFLTILPFQHPVDNYLLKEFIITVGENQTLDLRFNPSLNSSAFINGIEIVSMPDGLYTRGDNTTPLKLVGTDYYFYLDNSYAFETAYRINVGGASIGGIHDTGMYRTWDDDSVYVYGASGFVSRSSATIKYTSTTPAFVAPDLVYSSVRSMGEDPIINLNYNLTWIFSVDAGFNYLVRLHFCETRSEVNAPNNVVFSIFINNQTAEEHIDVFEMSGSKYVPVYKDYIVSVPRGNQKEDLWLALNPFTKTKPTTNDAILNGLEIMKLNNSAGSLAASNPNPPSFPVPSPKSKTKMKSKLGPVKVITIVGAMFCGIFVVSLLVLLFIRRQRRSRRNTENVSLRPSKHFRKFTIFEIEVATENFDDEFVIGSGGFGYVYKGIIDDGATPVAIKRLHSSSKQGAKEFQTEIQLLTQLRHEHLVSLIGYCNDPGEMILVYEYMHRGTLRDHLYKTKNPPIPWKKRLEICIGAARGLHYLHTGVKYPVIHRDVKSTNILIDENWVAKVSDFGISKLGPTSESQTHVSTVVRGSFGYLDPEYYRRQQLTEKSDVYSFGAVMFEVLCGRPAVNDELTREQANLCHWARACYKSGALGEIVDPNLKGDIDPVCLRRFGEIADSCVRDNGRERPTMSDVVMELELILHLQETADNNMISVID